MLLRPTRGKAAFRGPRSWNSEMSCVSSSRQAGQQEAPARSGPSGEALMLFALLCDRRAAIRAH